MVSLQVGCAPVDSLQDFSLSNLSAALQETRAQQQGSQPSSHGNNHGQTSFYSQWGSADTYPGDSYNFLGGLGDSNLGPGPPCKNHGGQESALTFDIDLDPLNQSTASDKFGLNSSTSSTGLQLADMVTKIVDEDSSHKFGLGDLGLEVAKSRTSSDVFSFDR